MGFRVIDVHTHETLPGIPTPRLIEAGGGEVYPVQNMNGKSPVWYLHEKGYESPDGTYRRASIVHTDEYRVDVHIAIFNEKGEPEDEPYDDWFLVIAAGESEAGQLGVEKAREDIERRYGDVATDIAIIRARVGGYA